MKPYRWNGNGEYNSGCCTYAFQTGNLPENLWTKRSFALVWRFKPVRWMKMKRMFWSWIMIMVWLGMPNELHMDNRHRNKSHKLIVFLALGMRIWMPWMNGTEGCWFHKSTSHCQHLSTTLLACRLSHAGPSFCTILKYMWPFPQFFMHILKNSSFRIVLIHQLFFFRNLKVNKIYFLIIFATIFLL